MNGFTVTSAPNQSVDASTNIVSVKGIYNKGQQRIINFHWGSSPNEIVLFSTSNKTSAFRSGQVTVLQNIILELRHFLNNHPNNLPLGPFSAIISKLATSVEKSIAIGGFPQDVQQTLTSNLQTLRKVLHQCSANTFSVSSITADAIQVLTSTQNVLKSQQNATENFSPKNDSNVVIFRWDSFLDETRKLISESHSYFVDIQKKREELSLSDFKDLLWGYSKHYRAIITAQSESLKQATSNHNYKVQYGYMDVAKEYEHQSSLFHISNIVWHFAEIFFISTTDYVTNLLIDWYYIHWDHSVDIINQVLQAPVPEQHPSYWAIIFKSLIHGQIISAKELLGLHSGLSRATNDMDDLNSVIQALLDSIPVDLVHPDYLVHFKAWQDDCEKVKNARPGISEDPNWSCLFGIFCGDDDVLFDISETWQELLLAKLVWSEPGANKYDIRHVASQIIERFQSLKALDRILLSILNFDGAKAVMDCSTYFANSWLAAHLADMLYHSEGLEPDVLKTGLDVRDTLLMQYALALLSNKALWPIAFSYLSSIQHDPTFSKRCIAELIERQQPMPESKAFKLLQSCQVYGLEEQTRNIHRVIGMMRLKQGRFGSAIQWLINSKDTERLSEVANKILDEFLKQGSLEDVDAIIEKLDTDFPLSEELTFIEKYRELHVLAKKGDYTAFCNLTLKLLISRVAPLHFWPSLLLDVVHLLDMHPNIFGVEEGFQLMHCLNEVTLSHRNDQLLANVHEKDIQYIQLTLSKHLAGAFSNGNITAQSKTAVNTVASTTGFLFPPSMRP